MKEKNNNIWAGSKKLQIFLLLSFSLILAFVLAIPTSNFTSTDSYPNIIPLTPQKIINFGGSPSDITVGMYIRDITEANFVGGTFTVDLSVWFIFNPTLIPLEKITKFSFDSAKVKHKSKPYTRIIDKKLLALYDMKIEFSVSMNYQNFPFDDHKISFSLTHYYLSPSEAIFTSSKYNFMINKEVNIAGWQIVEKWIKTGFIEDTLNPYEKNINQFHPRVVFSIDLARSGIRHIVTILIPLILIFFIAAFTLAFDPKGLNAGHMVPISIASISAVIAHRFVIESMSPNSGSFMISDKLFLLFLFSTFAIFFINVFTPKIKGIYKNIMATLLYLFVLASTIYILSPLF